jgi:peptide/nickel transport system substrate-binding protein
VDKRKKKETWNLFFTGFGTGTAVGARAAVMNYLQPRNMSFSPGDPVLEASYQRMGTEITLEARKKAFAEVQARIYEQVYGLKFGDYYKWTATRSNVKGFVPYRIPRLWNVSFK